MCSTAVPNFEGPKLKVQRAGHHVNEIKSVFEAFLKTEFCKLHTEREPETGQYLVKITSIAKTPAEITLALGDAVHAMRTALDHAISGLVPSEAHWISFPTGEKRDDLIASRSYGAVKKALPDLADFIADKIQPYRGGDFKVWEISALDNMDKHRLLIPTISVHALTGVDVEDERGSKFVGNTFGIREGKVAIAISTPTPLKITNYGRPAANILFPKDAIFENQAVIPTLLQLAQFTAKAIGAIETFHFGNVANPNAVKT